MAIRVIDKIKQKNNQAFKLLDYIDIEGRITGWQNPVKQIVANVASIPSLSDGDLFILVDSSGTWEAFTSLDVYGNVAAPIDNAIYQKQTSIVAGQQAIYYLVTGAVKSMITLDESTTKLKVYNGTAWVDLISPSGGTVTGEVLRAELHLIVDTLSDPGANYSTSTHHLLTGEVMQTGDNVNIYVNGLKYTNTGTAPAVSFTVGESYLVWNTDNAGFELTDGDEVEIEIFNVE